MIGCEVLATTRSKKASNHSVCMLPLRYVSVVLDVADLLDFMGGGGMLGQTPCDVFAFWRAGGQT